jgi:hypothetical protein
MSWIKRMLRGASPEELAARELDSARRALLEAQSAREYADAMVTYHRTRIERLRAVLKEADHAQEG